MTIDEAIEALENENRRTWGDGFPKIREAVQLGIEALKGIKKVRKTFRPYVEALLPGETQE